MFEFQNADICPAARQAFLEYTDLDIHDAQEMDKAARNVDQMMGILKGGYARGFLAEHDYDAFLTHLEDAEDILETLGVLEDHDYLRNDLEPRATELLNVDEIDVDDEAPEYDDSEMWIFGSSNEDNDD